MLVQADVADPQQRGDADDTFALTGPRPHLKIPQRSGASAPGTPPPVVWAASEREEMRELRRWFLQQLATARDDVAVAGYRKRGETTTDTDQRRRRNYERVLARGGGLQDVDDLADDI